MEFSELGLFLSKGFIKTKPIKINPPIHIEAAIPWDKSKRIDSLLGVAAEWDIKL